MVIKTKEFNEVVNVILVAVDNNTANLELNATNNTLYLNVANKEYFCSVKFNLTEQEEFRAVVDAQLFLNLVSGITTETFELSISENTVVVRAGRSKYKLAMIYENDELMKVTPIILKNPTVDMNISNDILKSILNVNGRELLKIKNIDVNELQKLYYITEDGAFTFTTGACLNSFKLEKPIKMLLNDRIVKLFKLFKSDVLFKFGHDDYFGTMQTKVVFETEDIYLAALIVNDDILLNKIQGPYAATKRYLEEQYSNRLVLPVRLLSAAVNRLMQFTKNSVSKSNMALVPVDVEIVDSDFIMQDSLGNTEVISISNDSRISSGYKMSINMADLKLVLDSCKEEYITLNCGNNRSVVITRGNISNLIPEKANR